jgi:catechol 2,3-dioxygenase-like lactoylglutathione lyase family enzyme
MDLNPPPPPGPLPVDTDPGHLVLHGVPQARLRFIQARIPGVRCGIEIVELTNVDRAVVRRRVQDPGAVTLVLTLRDIDSAFAVLKKAGVPIVTSGGAPIAFRGGRAVTVRDPDDHYVELQQLDAPAQTTIAPLANVIGIGLRLTVADLDRALEFYRHVLGVVGTPSPFERDRARLSLAGLPPSAELRSATVSIPNTSHTLDLVEYRGAGAAKAAVPSRVQDPGSYRLQLTFKSIDAALSALSAEGLHTISTGGVPVRMSFGGRPWQLAIVPDPQNLFLIVQEAPPRTE